MIRLCTCTRGSASTLEPSRKRAATASCKTCGGKPLVDERGSLSGSMLSTLGLELTGLMKSDLTWKTVSKGNRSASRRARKPVARSLEGSGELVDKDSKRVGNMPISESEKLGVTILGCHFSDRVEHVPIKKRRFLFQSPSPPPRTPSPPRPEGSERLINSHPVSGQKEFYCNSIAKQRLMEVDAAVETKLGQVVDGKNSEEINEKLGDGEDFSGISILAAAACNNSMGVDGSHVEEGSVVEESSARERSPGILVKKELCFVAKGLSKEHHLNFADISNQGTDFRASATANEHGYNTEGTFLPHSSVDVLQNYPSNKDDGTVRKFEFSSRDDRSHWDLNTVMDVWECPCDIPIVDSQTNASDGILEDGMPSENLGNLEGCEMQSGPGDTKYNIERTLTPTAGRVVPGDVHGDTYRLADPNSLALGTHKLNRGELKLHACTGPDGTTNFKEKFLSSRIDNAPNSMMDPAEETKSLHNQERISSSVESVVSAPVEHSLEPSTSAVAEENASTQCSDFGYMVNSEILSSHLLVSMDQSPCPGSDCIPSTWVSEEDRNAVSASALVKQNRDDCAADEQFGESMCSKTRSAQAEMHDVALPHAAVSEKATSEIHDVNEDGEASNKISGLHDGGNVPKTMSMNPCHPLGPGRIDDAMEIAFIKSVGMNISISSPNCEELSTLAASVVKGQLVVDVETKVQERVSVADAAEIDYTLSTDTKVQDDNVSVADTTEIDYTVHFNSEELTHKSSGQSTDMLGAPGDFSSHEASHSYDDDPVNSSGKVALEDPFDNSYDSDFSQDDPGHVHGMERESELHAGYDSQYEDGEFRESVVHSWEEYADEQVDYGSDKIDTYGFDAADYSVAMSVQVEEGAECKKERSAHEDHFGCELSAGADKVVGNNGFCVRGDAPKESTIQSVSSRMKLSGWGRFPEGSKSSADKIVEVSDGSTRKNHNGEHVDAQDSMKRVFRSGTSKRELLSCIEGPTSSDVLPGKDRVFIQGSRSNNLYDSNTRAVRETHSAKSIGRGSLHMHGRGWGGDRWVDPLDGHLGLKRYHSHSYHDLAGFRSPGTKNATTAAAAKVESSGFAVATDGAIVKAGGMGPKGRFCRQSVNSSSQGVHRSLTRRGSPANWDEAFSRHMGNGTVGEMIHDRSIPFGRGKYGRYGSRLVGRGPRERYNRPVPDAIIEHSLRMPHPLYRRERNFSPVIRRGAPHLSPSHTKSPSRSRTRSPHERLSPRGRIQAGSPGFRNRSGSPPNFRSEARMKRARSPYRCSDFAVDHIVGIMSLPRNGGSIQHTSRWINDRRDAVDQFREHGYKQRSSFLDRKSPGRIHPRSHKFDLVDSSGSLNPDEYYRPMHPGRFPELVGGGRRHRFVGSDDDRRKHGNRYGMVRPIRHYDMDGAVKKFRYDVKDDFAAHNSHKEDTDFYGRGSPMDYDSSIDCRRRDASGRAREEKGQFRYGRDGKYNVRSKSFGMRECDEDIAPTRRRPS